MPIKNEVRTRLGDPEWKKLRALAAARGRSLNEIARDLLEQSLRTQEGGLVGQPEAERQLFERAREIARRHRANDDWTEDIILTVFGEIANDMESLYQEAVTEENANRVHREIGRIIRKELGAVTRKIDGRLQYRSVPRAAPVPIKTYTLLFKPET